MEISPIEKLIQNFLNDKILRYAQDDRGSTQDDRRFAQDDKKPLVVLLGPTASGKTGLSLKLAQSFNGEVISADSRQVYRHMNIGTAKVSPQEQGEIAHHCLDIVNPDERFTAADFKARAESAINDILARGKIPFLVGGTGLYIDVVTKNFNLPPEDRALRARLLNELKEHGADYMHAKLATLDAKAAAKIHAKNSRYVIRALEIALATGKPKNEAVGAPRYEVLKLGLSLDREQLYERINFRAAQQVEMGLFEETHRLLAMGYSPSLPSMSVLGYRESIQYLTGELNREQALALIQQNCRNYARRQMSWFRRDTKIEWVRV